MCEGEIYVKSDWTKGECFGSIGRCKKVVIKVQNQKVLEREGVSMRSNKKDCS
jgi:hypothetical protein